MTFIYGEENDPPMTVTLLYNFIFLAICLAIQILNISPNEVMAIAGASSGFVIIYLHPLSVHLKTLAVKKRREKLGIDDSNDEELLAKPNP